ncbi:MAG: hypothetical protein JXQ65_15715 [Candidatus Marinimicrobia bacterium]|nr:hypothetical protein [Candidatus Neomarinimicrobiota bacterium]
MNNYFNLQRFLQTLKNDIIRNSRNYLITLGAIAGILTSIDLLPGIITGKTLVPVHGYLPLFMLMGYIFSSLVFNEMHDPQKGLVFLTTPSSSLEKLFSKLLITSLLYVLVMWLFFQALTLFLNGLNAIFFGTEPTRFTFHWGIARIFIITQSVFLFASGYFRKNAFLKLLFAGFVLQMFFSFFSIINFKLFFNISDFHNIEIDALDLDMGRMADLIKALVYGARFTFLWLMAPFFWFMTYLRIAEKEV